MVREKDCIPANIRSQLLTLGIPASKHTWEALVAFFPREFNIAASGLDAENLARVLVHFATRGIIALPTARAAIKDVKPGWHCCRFYQDDEQLLEMVAPYFATGLENGEGCLWVVPSSVTSKDACDVVGRFVNDVDAYVASGQLEVLTHDNWYLDASGRFKAWEEIRGALVEKQERALGKGFKFLRAAGDAGWVSGTEQSKEFIAYEMKVNSEIGATQIAAVCTFRADVTADELIAIVTAHQDAIYTQAVA